MLDPANRSRRGRSRIRVAHGTGEGGVLNGTWLRLAHVLPLPFHW